MAGRDVWSKVVDDGDLRRWTGRRKETTKKRVNGGSVIRKANEKMTTKRNWVGMGTRPWR